MVNLLNAECANVLNEVVILFLFAYKSETLENFKASLICLQSEACFELSGRITDHCLKCSPSLKNYEHNLAITNHRQLTSLTLKF